MKLLGRVSERDATALYVGADLFVFPSRHEGFGIPVLEAMAQGTPVVCSDIPVFREVGGDAARFVPVDDVAALADTIGSVLGDAAARDAAHSRRARARPGLLLGTLRRRHHRRLPRSLDLISTRNLRQ